LHLPEIFWHYPCEQLTQPASVTVQPGQRLTITCQVSYSVSSYWTAWIRQPAGKGLEWIIVGQVGYSTHTKDSLKNQFSINFDSSSNRVTLNGLNMQPADTAVYYCARDPHGVHSTSLSTSTMFSVALLLLLAAGCESVCICQSQQFFFCSLT
uniref:Ig-like domain-containing protein n=1 Tax=Labrus bergylta TaxID=56723 RepID=A0A3Q3LFP2_9LABR